VLTYKLICGYLYCYYRILFIAFFHDTRKTILTMRTPHSRMTDTQKERENKLQMLKEGKLNPKQKADFYYKMAKILAKELGRLKELSMMLEATPDSYLTRIDFREAATFAMDLTETLIKRTNPPRISQELTDGTLHAERIYKIDLGNLLPGLKYATLDLKINSKPTREELNFNRRLRDHKTAILPNILDYGKYPLKEFINNVLPSLRANDPGLKIKNHGIAGYKPLNEFGAEGESTPVDQKLLDAIGKLVKEIGTGYPSNIMALPDMPDMYEEWPPK